MTVIGDVIPRSALPPAIRVATSERRATKERRGRPAKWMRDEATLKRTLAVYKAYMQRMSLAQIAAEYHISVSQIYRDIDNARAVYSERFALDLDHAVQDQVEARRRIIEESYASLTAVRAYRASPQRLHAEANILRVINDGEKAIEELMGLRNRQQTKPDQAIEDQTVQQPGVIVLDMRRLNGDGTFQPAREAEPEARFP